MKVTILFPCNTDKTNVTIVYQLDEVKVLNQGTFETFAFRDLRLCFIPVSFTNGPPCRTSAGRYRLLPFCMLFFMRLTYVHVHKVRAAAVVYNKSRTGPMLSEWRERNAKLKLTSLTLLCNRSKAGGIRQKVCFPRLLSRARYRYAPPSNLVSPTWLLVDPMPLDVLSDLTAWRLNQRRLMNDATIELFRVRVK